MINVTVLAKELPFFPTDLQFGQKKTKNLSHHSLNFSMLNNKMHQSCSDRNWIEDTYMPRDPRQLKHTFPETADETGDPFECHLCVWLQTLPSFS